MPLPRSKQAQELLRILVVYGYDEIQLSREQCREHDSIPWGGIATQRWAFGSAQIVGAVQDVTGIDLSEPSGREELTKLFTR